MLEKFEGNLPPQEQIGEINKKMKKATQIINVIECIILPFSVMTPILFMLMDEDVSISFVILISYPIILILSLVFSRNYYKQERYKLAFWLSFIPALPGILFLIVPQILLLTLMIIGSILELLAAIFL